MPAHPRYHASEAPDRPALVMSDQGTAIGYGQLVANADKAATLFLELGICEGDTIAILLENHLRYPELLWAAKNSGLRYVCISTHLNVSDAAYIIRDCSARLLIAGYGQANLADRALAELDKPVDCLVVGSEAGDPRSYEARVAQVKSRPPEGRRRGPSMLYSSGTTGRPKGVRTTLPDAGSDEPPQRYAMMMEQYGLGPDTVFINPGPFYHAGPNRFMMSVLRAGGTVIGLQKFDPLEVLGAIERYRVTHGFFVPTMFSRMLALPDDARMAFDTSSLRHAIHGAAPCPEPLKRRMIEWWGPVIDELYAGTEAFGHTFINSRDWLDHPGSVGRPAHGCEIRIVDEEGNCLPARQPGRIMMRNGLRIEYHGDAAKTGSLYDKDGFASLGDVGYLDEDGFLYLTDRESHMIIVGGVNVYPQEAERVLAESPHVADVAVIGVPDPDLGEKVHALIVPTASSGECDERVEADIRAFCEERLSRHKCPRSYEFVDGLPRNPMGKLLKRELREKYWREAGRLI